MYIYCFQEAADDILEASLCENRGGKFDFFVLFFTR